MRGHFECEYFGPMRHGHHGGPFGRHEHHGHGPFGHHGHHGGPFGHHGHHGHHGHKHGHGKFGHHHGFGPWGHHGFGPHFGMRFGPWSMDGGRRCGADGPCKRGPTEEVGCRRGREDGPGRHAPEDGPFRRGPFGHFHGRGPWDRPGSPGCGRMAGRKEKGCCCRKDDSKKDKGTQAFVIERVIVENDPRCNSV